MIHQTGDVILFKGNGAFSAIITAPTEARYSHVAMYVDHPKYGPCLFESTSVGVEIDLVNGELVKGVQLTRFADRVESYDGKVFCRSINGVRTQSQLDALYQFIDDWYGKPYEGSYWELANAEIDGPLPWHKNKPDISSVFCSETYVSAARVMGMVSEDGESANEYTPTDCDADLKLCVGFNWGVAVALKV
jgi:hypothetical protein